MHNNYISIISEREKIKLTVSSIMYCISVGKNIEIHKIDGHIITTRTTISELEQMLGSSFIKIHRGCIVAARAIHDIGNTVLLLNGESLSYTIRKKKQIRKELTDYMISIVDSRNSESIPTDFEGYCEHYRGMENMPFAFTDIEMVFDRDRHATDWIFRYGNKALAKLEKMSLDMLIGRRFSEVFKNMDKKWLIAYERAAMLKETIEFNDYSPEIDTYIKVICFPTFDMHCACIMFNISDIIYTELSDNAKRTFDLYSRKKRALYK